MSKQPLKIMVNGELLPDISVMDRGFQYGDGLFETMLVINNEIPFWERHCQRLAKGCERLSIAFPDLCQVRADIDKLIKDVDKGVVKLIVSRGITGRGYAISEAVTPQAVLILINFPDYPETFWQEGVVTRICDLRLSHQPLLAGIKHLNRLEQVMARNEWNSSDIIEGIVCDQNNNVIEGIMSNIFIVNNNKVLTPQLDQCGVEGVMRNRVLELLNKENINGEITEVNQEQLFSADEVFLTNSIIGIWPVRKIGDRVYQVGHITRQLQDRLVQEKLIQQ